MFCFLFFFDAGTKINLFCSMDEKESETAAQKVNAIIGELETLKQG